MGRGTDRPRGRAWRGPTARGAALVAALALLAPVGPAAGFRSDEPAREPAPASTTRSHSEGLVVVKAKAKVTTKARLVLPVSWKVTKRSQLRLKAPAGTKCRVVRGVKAGSRARFEAIDLRCKHAPTRKARTLKVTHRKTSQRLHWTWVWGTPRPGPGGTPPPASQPGSSQPAAPPRFGALPAEPAWSTLRGDRNDYALNPQGADPNDPIGFDPCAPIDVAINANGYPQAEVARVVQAIGKVAATSGLTIRHAGASTAIPVSGKKFPVGPGVEIVFALTRPDQSDLLAGGTYVGHGGWKASNYLDGTPRYFNTAGYAVIDTPRALGLSENTRLLIYMHELAHAIGLQHAKSPAQVMYPTQTDAIPATWGAGDTSGLRKLGNLRCRS